MSTKLSAWLATFRNLVQRSDPFTAFMLLGYLGFNLLQTWNNRWIQDDAFISLRYAWNAVHGHGLVFNPGENVQGYTNFLWTLVCTGAEWLTSDSITALHHVGLVLLLASYAMLYMWMRKQLFVPRTVALMVIVVLSCCRSYQLWFLSGMETGLVACLWVAYSIALHRLLRQYQLSLLHVLPVTVLAILIVLTRLDQAAVLSPSLLLLLWHAFKNKQSRTVLVYIYTPIVVTVSSYLLWAMSYYGGDILPNTFYAKQAFQAPWQRGYDYVWHFFVIYSATAVTVAASYALRRSLDRAFSIAILATWVCLLAYVISVGGDFMEWRFLLPVFAVVAAWSLISTYADKWVFWFCAFGLSAMFLQGSSLSKQLTMPGQETISSLERYAYEDLADWRGTGKLLRDVFGAELYLGTTAAGMISYDCQCKVLDLHGLNDREIARQRRGVQLTGRVGHDLELVDVDVMRERGVQALLRWPDLWPSPQAETLKRPSLPGNRWISIKRDDGRFTNLQIIDESYYQKILASLNQNPRLKFKAQDVR